MVASDAVGGSCSELTAPCHSEPQLLTVKKHFPGDGGEDAECVQRGLEDGGGAAGRFSLSAHVPFHGRLCAGLGHNWSAG